MSSQHQDRFSLSDSAYLTAHHIPAYLTDALGLIWHLEKGDEKQQQQQSNSSASSSAGRIKSLEFLAAYFTLLSSRTSSAVLHRDFRFVNSTPATRLAFILVFRRVYIEGLENEVLTPESVHQLCLLLCVDFPFSLVRNAARITTDVPPATSASTAAASTTSGMSLRDFAHKLFVLFFYSEFLNQCALTFRAIDSASSGRVHRRLFLTRLLEVREMKAREFSCPEREAIEDALRSPSERDGNGAVADDEIMFNSFCVELFAHRRIHQALSSEWKPLIDE
jgi:hypothetical protein